VSHPTPLTSNADRDAARSLVASTCLKFEEGFDDLVGIFDARRLVACGARAGRVLKMLVVDPAHRGEGLLGDIVAELMRRGREAGVDGFFIFTRPETSPVFEGLAFKQLVCTDHAALLEHGNGLHHYFRQRAGLIRSGRNAAVVLTSDPFSSGHQHLAEHASERADWVYVLVPSEGRFVWPLDVRLDLARQGTRHLSNVIVTETGPYALSSATFPAYFLKPGEAADEVRLEVDVELFARHLAPAFSLETRVAGTEPLDPMLRRYNQIMQKGLARRAIRFLQVERKKLGGRWINTAAVHKAFMNRDLPLLQELVPEPTFAHLQSPESEPFIETLRQRASAHR